ncbi:MAG: TIGR04438 family Trp-rich protein [Burkholderiales bacterium]|nr:TIGR04438 family Trp-rich protein [Burkholderiales bacterium]
MWFIVVGVVLLALKLSGWGPVALWSWWYVLAPFGAAFLWWTFADASGLTKKRAMDREDKRVKSRRQRHLENMGLDLIGRRGRKKD